MAQKIIDIMLKLVGDGYLSLFLLSLTPLIEMRGAVILSGDMAVNPLGAALVCWLASTMVAPLVLFVARPIICWLKKTKTLKKFAERYEAAQQKKAEIKGLKKTTGAKPYVLLCLFVAVPLPMTGVWSGAAIAAAAGLSAGQATTAIAFGNLIATLLMLTVSLAFRPYTNIVFAVFIGLIILASLIALIKAVRGLDN